MILKIEDFSMGDLENIVAAIRFAMRLTTKKNNEELQETLSKLNNARIIEE